MATQIKSAAGSSITFDFDGTEHVLDLQNKTLTPKGSAALNMGDDGAKPILDAFVGEVKKSSAKLDDGVKKVLQGGLQNIDASHLTDTETLEEMQKAAKAAASIESANTNVAAAQKNLLKNPAAESFLTRATQESLITKKLDFAKLESLQAAQQKLRELITAESPKVDSIKSLLIDHADHAEEMLGNIKETNPNEVLGVAKKLNILNINELITTPISTAADKAKSLVADIISQAKSVENIKAQKNPDAEALKAAEENLTKSVEAFKKETGGEFGHKVAEKVKAGLSTGEAEAFAKASKDADAHLQLQLKKAGVAVDAAKTAEKTGRGFKATAFFASEEKLAERLAKNSGKELGFIKSLSGLKALGWGVGAVTAVYLTGIGRNPDKGKYTSMVAANDQQPQQGAARA